MEVQSPRPVPSHLGLPALFLPTVDSAVRKMLPLLISTISFIVTNLVAILRVVLATVNLLCYQLFQMILRTRQAIYIAWVGCGLKKRYQRAYDALVREMIIIMLQPASVILVLLWPGWVVIGLAWWWSTGA